MGKNRIGQSSHKPWNPKKSFKDSSSSTPSLRRNQCKSKPRNRGDAYRSFLILALRSTIRVLFTSLLPCRFKLECRICPWYTEFRHSHLIFKSPKVRLAIIYIFSLFLRSSTPTSPLHLGWVIVLVQFLTLRLQKLFHIVLLGMTRRRSWSRERKTIKWRLCDRLYASLFSYDMSFIIFKAFCEL